MTGTQDGDRPSWDDVLALVAQLDASGLADAEVVAAGVTVRVSRTVLDRPASATPAPAPSTPAPSTLAPLASAPSTPAPSTPAPPAPAPTAPAPPAPGTASATSADEPVEAPMLGVFYRRPAPDQPPFVEVGDTVTAQTTVAIIEVMKLMNPVTAGVAGVVTEVCVPDGQLVEHGDVLLRVRAGG
jgi:acetyl-CoA carboxylase biotin carboxyl carrier protein